MMRPLAAQPEFTTLFDWSPPRARKIPFISFVSASAVLHLFCFYVFQIVYPPAVALIPPPARVNIITPSSGEGRTLLQWIDAEDPALSSTTQRPAEASFSPPASEHVPSYESRKPGLREPPAYQPDLRVPSSQPPGPVRLTRRAGQTPTTTTPTELRFSDDLQPLGTSPASTFHFTTLSKEPPQAASYRVGIDSRGDVRYCFLQHSSGDLTLDQEGRRVVLLCRFSPLENRQTQDGDAFVWTTATFEWGNDLVPPIATSADSPAP
ncbi:MAG: hypothetical protein H0T95_11115 [Chthoniobacterales bacterium]|nr:hypothetical protein [Chthoniobacterales bacterium]MBA3761906.1 hypothetical protein [Chthoniobacterales bacterium]